MGIVVGVLAIFMLAESMKSENPDDATVAEQKRIKEKQNAALNKTEQAPAREDLDQTLAAQAKEAQERIEAAKVPQSASLPSNLVPTAQAAGPLNLPPLPSGKARPDSGLPSPEGMKEQGNQEAQMAAKREEQILASPIDLPDFFGPIIPGKWLPVWWLKDTAS